MNNKYCRPFNSPQEFQDKFNKFVQDYRGQWNQDPKEKVQELLDSGRMTQEQYNRFREMANWFLGTNY